MAKLVIRTVTIEAPLPFTDEDAESFIGEVDLSLNGAIESAVRGVIDAAKGHPLADVVSVTVSS